jgi:hypothetical protein
MPKKEDDKSVVTHPLSFEEVLTRMLNTPPVNPAKRRIRRRKKKRRHGQKDNSIPASGEDGLDHLRPINEDEAPDGI